MATSSVMYFQDSVIKCERKRCNRSACNKNNKNRLNGLTTTHHDLNNECCSNQCRRARRHPNLRKSSKSETQRERNKRQQKASSNSIS